jgi:hypothetical protein
MERIAECVIERDFNIDLNNLFDQGFDDVSLQTHQGKFAQLLAIACTNGTDATT